MTRFYTYPELTSKSLAADKSYGTGPFLAWLEERRITQLIPVLDRTRQTDGKLTRDAFTYDPERDTYTCPEGHALSLQSVNEETRVKRYLAPAGTCRACPIRARCTDTGARSIVRLMDEEVREKVRALAETPAVQVARRR
ncbi:MAG: transposase, partial [Pseudomonadota bacterium]